MAGPVGVGGSGYVQPKRIKRNWRYILLCAAIIALILYFWLHGSAAITQIGPVI